MQKEKIKKTYQKLHVWIEGCANVQTELTILPKGLLAFYSTMICARVVKNLVWNTNNSPPMQLRNLSTNWPYIQRILNRILPAIDRLRDCLEIVALMFTFLKSFQVSKRLGKSFQIWSFHFTLSVPAFCRKYKLRYFSRF